MTRIAEYVLCTVAFAALGIPVPAAAQSCATFLNNINNWFITKPEGTGTYEILLTQVGNNSEGTLANYVEGPSGGPGVLTYHAKVRGSLEPPFLQGTVLQYFNARRFDPTNTGQFPWAPFDPNHVDSLGVTIALGNAPQPPLGSGVKLGQVTFILYSWGNLQLSMQGLCQDGLLYGIMGDSIQLMSLNEHFSQVTK